MNTIHEVIETPMYELAETELDAASGGLFDFLNTVVQGNTGSQLGLNILTAGGGVAQVMAQANSSNI